MVLVPDTIPIFDTRIGTQDIKSQISWFRISGTDKQNSISTQIYKSNLVLSKSVCFSCIIKISKLMFLCVWKNDIEKGCDGDETLFLVSFNKNDKTVKKLWEKKLKE